MPAGSLRRRVRQIDFHFVDDLAGVICFSAFSSA
jgi:hypothetical protein